MGANPGKRRFLKLAATAALISRRSEAETGSPNFVFINTDDLGYGDVGCYGSPIRTPHLSQMAATGARFRQFCSASPVCSPSRAALLTGRYPTRVGVTGVLWPDSKTGLDVSETTIAQVLKARGYRTMCVGKWHVGSLPQFLPTSRGFDEYFGIPYSHDMDPLSLYYNKTVIEQPCRIDTLAQRYTQQAVDFIARSASAPFFLYLAHHMPHLPLAASVQFRGKSGLGLYGDAVQEVDWSVGQIFEALANYGVENNTLVMFSSDHGPWYQGSAGRLRGRKGQTFEGGVRVPFLACFPGRIPKGLVVNGLASHMDVLPTVARLAGAPLPGKPLDGVDIWPLLSGEKAEVERDALLYFDAGNLQCARLGRWKLHVSRYNIPPWIPEPKEGQMILPLPHPELYNVDASPDESFDEAAENPQVVADIRARIEALIPTFPIDIQNFWYATMSKKVEETPAGAYPVSQGLP